MKYSNFEIKELLIPNEGKPCMMQMEYQQNSLNHNVMLFGGLELTYPRDEFSYEKVLEDLRNNIRQYFLLALEKDRMIKAGFVGI